MRMFRIRRILTVVGIVAIVMMTVLPFVLDQYLITYETVGSVIVCVLFALELWLWRCPHCSTYLWGHGIWTFERFCPYCGKDLYDDSVEWYDDFARLNYMHGDVEYFENGGADMLTVTYEDGMRIHVGYDGEEHEFVIKVLENDTDESKVSPLSV